jgi:hypothetical protein
MPCLSLPDAYRVLIDLVSNWFLNMSWNSLILLSSVLLSFFLVEGVVALLLCPQKPGTVRMQVHWFSFVWWYNPVCQHACRHLFSSFPWPKSWKSYLLDEACWSAYGLFQCKIYFFFFHFFPGAVCNQKPASSELIFVARKHHAILACV